MKEPRSEVFNVDCVTFMRTLPDDYFDFAVADPPYGINLAGNSFRGKHEKKDWDCNVPDKTFFDELFRISKNQIIWGGNYFGLPPNKHFLIWDKEQGFDFSSAMCEYAWSSLDKPAKLFRFDARKRKTNIHPTMKPIELYSWIFKNYVKEGETIFDPMVGSGSSRIAAYKLGFDFYGCEIDKDYFDAQEKRFASECFGETQMSNGETVKQLNLF